MEHSEEYLCPECGEMSTQSVDLDLDLDSPNQPYIVANKECPHCEHPIEVIAKLDIYFE